MNLDTRDYNSVTIPTLVLLIALTPSCVLAVDWPNWRGPRHNGISDETHWGANWANCTPKVLWQQQVGTGFSSIAVAKGQLYTLGNNEAGQDTVYCFNAGNGAVVWTHSYAEPLADLSYEGGPSATPTVADGRVYTLSKKGIAYCLDATDGSVEWRRDLAATYGVRAPQWGFAGSPYIEGDIVIYNVGTHGLALNASNGMLAWQTGTGRPGYSTPVPFDFDQQRHVVLMGEKTFAAVHAQTGRLLWEQPWVTSYNANIPDLVVDGNLVFVSTGYREGSALFDVSTGQAAQIWFQKNMQTFLNSAVLWRGYLYGPNDNGDAVTCVDRSTGNIVWTQPGFGTGSLTLADGKLIILSGSGYLCIAEASPTGYQETARGRILAGRCWSVPVLANGRIYARNATGTLVSAELQTTAPKVNAGSSILTWLRDGTTTVALNGSVEDDTGDVTTIRWSRIAPVRGADVDFADDSAPTTMAAFTQTGIYTLQLYAMDATGQEGSDQIEVSVYADSCEAAEHNQVGDYAPSPYDYDGNCVLTFSDFAMFALERLQTADFSDLAVFAARWLIDGSLTADILYDAD